MRVEVLAVGTELLLGQIADTNSAWIGQQLAAAAGQQEKDQAQAKIILAHLSPFFPSSR